MGKNQILNRIGYGVAVGAAIVLFQGCGVSGYNFTGSLDALNMSGGSSDTGGTSGVTGGSGSNVCEPGPIIPPKPGCKGHQDPSFYSCDGGCGDKIWICHVPEGNPSNAQSLCIDLAGAINGHGISFDGSCGGHGGDYPGKCECKGSGGSSGSSGSSGTSGSTGGTGPGNPVLGV